MIYQKILERGQLTGFMRTMELFLCLTGQVIGVNLRLKKGGKVELIIADGIAITKAFLEYEVGDYFSAKDIKITSAELYNGSVHVWADIGENSIELKISDITEPDEGDDIYDACKIEVCMCEDSYEQIKYYDWTIKYFWMSLLTWG